MSRRRFSHSFLLFVAVFTFSGLMCGQSITVQGTSETVKVPVVLERFSGTPAQASPARPNSVTQPGLEKSLHQAPAVAATANTDANAATATVTAEATSLTAPGPVLGQVFDVQSGFIVPSDAGIGAGPRHLVYGVNEQLEVYNKSGGSLLVTSFPIFFQSVMNGGCCFDPRVIYDSAHDRFILIAAGNQGTQSSHIFIAVTQTGDPTGNWFKFALNTQVPTPQGGPSTSDFPTVGLSSTELYLSASQVPATTGTETTYLWVLQLADLLAGNPTLHVTTFPNVKLPNGKPAFTIQPAIMYGNSPVAYLAATDSSPQVGGSSIHLFSIPTTGTPTLTVTEIPVAPFKLSQSAPQPNSSTSLGDIGDIISSTPVWRNGSLWITHQVADATTGLPTVRWYEVVTSTHTVRQSGTIHGAGAAFFPAITVTASGATDLVFYTSSSTQFASAAFAHREASQPLGQMPVQAIYQPGLAAYTASAGRWGDYTAISADPAGNSSWTLAQYPVDASTYRLSTAHLISAATPPASSTCSMSTVGVKICAPASGATLTSPVQISAASKGNRAIVAMKAYANGKIVASSSGAVLNAKVSLAKATYLLVVKGWDTAGVIYQKSENFTVH